MTLQLGSAYFGRQQNVSVIKLILMIYTASCFQCLYEARSDSSAECARML